MTERFGFPAEAEVREVFETDWDELKLAKRAHDAVLRNNDPPRIFRHGGALHWVEHGLISEPMTLQRFEDVLLRATSWWRPDQFGVLKQAKLLRPVADRLYQALAADRAVPELRGVSRIPILRYSDGSIVDGGYDGETCIAVDVPEGAPVLTGKCSLAEARRILTSPFVDFPFCGAGDRASAIALLLTLLLRDWIEGPVPLFAIDAPAAGTGKTLLAKTIHSLVMGLTPPCLGALPTDAEELRKDLVAKLRRAPSLIIYDNAVGTVRSGTLAAYATADGVFSARELGKSRDLALPVRPVIAITGNNMDIAGDRGELTRRYVRIGLDAGVEHPANRSGFKHPELSAFVESVRWDLINAAYALARRWIRAGRPAPELIPTFGSYEGWRYVVGGILEMAGLHGLLSDLPERLAAGDEEIEWGWFLLGLYRKSKGKQFTTDDVLSWAPIWDGRGPVREYPGGEPVLELPAAAAIRMERKDYDSRLKSMGHFLSNRKDRVYVVELGSITERDLIGDELGVSLADWARQDLGNPKRIKLTLRRHVGRARKAHYTVELKAE